MAGSLQIVLIGLIAILMLGLGCTVTPTSVKSTLSSPKAPAIGFLSQFGFMPLFAFGLAKILNVSDAQGISMVLIGCTPGGATSNLFTYYSRGEVSLSISMTVLSTLLSFGMMPLLLLIYIPPFTNNDTDIKIPFGQIALGLAVILIPVGIGMLLLHLKPNAAKIVENISTYLGLLVIAGAMILGSIQNSDLFSEGYKLYIPSICMGPAGFLAGYGLATLSKCTKKERRSIALETGIQNSTLTIAIILLTFPGGNEEEDQLQQDVLAFPLLYSLFLMATAVITTLVLRKLSDGEEEGEDDGDRDEATAVKEEKKKVEDIP